jgi:quinol monooxygenase YgiN
MKEFLMPEVVLVARITAKPGREAEVEAMYHGLIVPTHAEAGCELYAMHRVKDNPAQLVFVEKWASMEALQAHAQSAHVAVARAAIEETLVGPWDLAFLEPIPGGDPAKGAL